MYIEFLTKILFDCLKLLNDFSGLGLLIISTIAVHLAYKEIVLKSRPYVIPEIKYVIQDKKWFFHAVLVNKGEKPGIAKISRAILFIGDEKYPTNFGFDAILAPGERQRLAPMGHINELGRSKICGNEYRLNRVEIHLTVEARSVSDKRYKYVTECEYKVEVCGDIPQIELIKERLV